MTKRPGNQPIEPAEGADAFETPEDAEAKQVADAPKRRDDDVIDEIITLDTPD